MEGFLAFGLGLDSDSGQPSQWRALGVDLPQLIDAGAPQVDASGGDVAMPEDAGEPV